jgi:hypothetical protein
VDAAAPLGRDVECSVTLEEAEALLLEACEHAVDGTIVAAVAHLLKKIGAPLTTWTVGQAIDFMHIPTTRLTVGRTTYATRSRAKRLWC